MKLKGNKKSKRGKLSLKYNIQKRVREHRRRVRKEAKKLNIKKQQKRDPGIPNSWPFKAQLLQQMEKEQQLREKELAEKRAKAKQKAQKDRDELESQRRQEKLLRDAERRRKKAEAARRSQRESLRKILAEADVVLNVLDSRDPLGTRCAALEEWAKEAGKSLVFVVAKADLMPTDLAVQWMQVLGQTAPTVMVQAEAGRGGVLELLQMLGRAPGQRGKDGDGAGEGAPGIKVEPAKAVGLVGYPGTGKQALLRAMRREAKGFAPWLMERVGRLRPEPAPPAAAADAAAAAAAAAAALHGAVRGLRGAGAAAGHADADEGPPESGKQQHPPSAEPVAVVRHFLERASPQVLMEKFRLPAFNGAEGFLRLFSQARKMKTKSGNEPAVPTVAQRFLAELAVTPGCVCTPPGELTSSSFWPAHKSPAALQAVMQALASSLSAREAGPAAGAIRMSSAGFGPPIDFTGILAAADDEEEEVDADDAMGDDSEGDAEEGEEEEMLEGEESEDEGMEEDGDGA